MGIIFTAEPYIMLAVAKYRYENHPLLNKGGVGATKGKEIYLHRGDNEEERKVPDYGGFELKVAI